MASIKVVFGGVEGGWRGKVVSGVMSWIAQEKDGSGHDRGTYNGSTAMKETRTLNIYPIFRARVITTLSGSQYLKTMVEATTKHL
jgi:hypothetical protein